MRHIKLYEVHPGAKPAEETIERFLTRGEERGISREQSLVAIKIYLDFIEGKEIPEIRAGSKIAEALINIENLVMTLLDDDYSMQWIKKDLKKFS